MLTRLVVALAAALAACGSSHPAGPSPVIVPPPGTLSAPAAPLSPTSLLPATFDRAAVAALGLDPDYVRDLVYTVTGADGTPFVHPLETWSPDTPLHFCAGPDVDSAMVAAIAGQVAEAVGIPVTPGPCNVTFVLALSPDGRGHTQADRTFEGRMIVSARILLARSGELESDGLHEAGHVLGLGHSPRRDDVMAATDYGYRPRAFTSRELAVLGLIYPRTR